MSKIVMCGPLRHAATFLRRWPTRTVGKGNALITGLLKGCLDQGCRIELETRATELLLDRGGSGFRLASDVVFSDLVWRLA